MSYETRHVVVLELNCLFPMLGIVAIAIPHASSTPPSLSAGVGTPDQRIICDSY